MTTPAPAPANRDEPAAPTTPERLDGRSPDLRARRLAALKALLPEAFDLDGNLVEAKLLAALEPAAAGTPDDIPAFGLGWPGKQAAFAAAGVPTTATLRPDPAGSVNFDQTQNLLIEGDNLEVLKTLQRAYHGKVKMIYIDPPYNTGKDFVYPDRYGEGLDTYLKRTRQKDDDGFWKSTNSETSGRKHANWLSMMAPRLTLARNLLRDDGALFISIDENELVNLRQLSDETFGAENFVAEIVWAAGRKNDSRLISKSHEYIVCYARSASYLKDEQIEWRQRKKGLDDIYAHYERLKKRLGDDHAAITDGLKKWYKSLSDGHPAKSHKHYNHADARGVFFPADISWPGGGGPKYEVLHPTTRQPVKVPARGWITPDLEKMAKWISDDKVHFGEDENKVPTLKAYLKDQEHQAPYSVFYQDGRSATKRLRELMRDDYFDFPKDETVLQELMGMMSGDADLILDFFAGSGTTGHAVMAQNAADGGNRRYICVQLPEPLDEPVTLDDGVVCETIFDLTRERLKRAGRKVERDAGLGGDELDTGFRVFRLDGSNFTAWNDDPAAGGADLLDRLDQLADHTVPGRTGQDILWEVLLKMGLTLDLKLERFGVAGAPGVEFIGVHGRTRVVSTEAAIPTAAFEALLEQDPPPAELVVLDAAFADDTARANVATLYRQRKDDDGQPLCNLKVV